eukprot:CAMPEP_0201635724 /NCGR_PEP_ID=MMETSP0493-20130528/8153_1 /ASSEMBLY_ACC=CAM_ASM_000838 /TAXON_ID=420259 /ORGANISM="Thalassiosira gravida, Strain GMp14c1" /LENGTH=737 /DNA_ID=CAMNT_0048107729 /DNA_START=45 /DNA_END=2258 /DNA_ORIENTATION=+
MKNHMPTFKSPNIGSPLAPLTDILHGRNEIQHPTISNTSNTISQNVEGMHKEFIVFQKHLKNLVMMYKTRHQLMESLNENGLYTAKCYNEMLDGTPLARILVPKGKYHHVREEVKSPQLLLLPSPHNDDGDDDGDDDDSSTSSGSTEENEFVASNNNNNAVAAANPHLSAFLQGRVPYTEHYDDIDSTEYPEYGVVKRETLEPDEGSRIPQDLVSKPMQEPEGMKASRVMSMHASSPGTSQFAAGLDEPEGVKEGVKASKVVSVKASGASRFPASRYPAVSDEPEGKKEGVKASKMVSVKASGASQFPPSKYPAVSNEPEGVKEGMKASKMVSVKASEDVSRHASGDRSRNNKDPPSAHSITSGKSIAVDENDERTGSGDPPSRKSFSDDKTVISVEKNPNWESDDITDGAVHRDVGDGINQIIVDDDEDSFTHGKVSSDTRVSIEDRKRESGHEEAEFAKGILADDEEAPLKLPYAPLVPNAESENGNTNGDADTRSNGSNSAGDVEKIGNEDQDYLNISNDGELLVIKGSPKPGHTSPQPPPFDSYYDVHKAQYKEMKSKLEEHSHLVAYVETWMETVSTRVQGRYIRYGKHRNGLNHYTSKVNSLRHEQEKLKEKNKAMKPKQIDKLDRNKAKLTEACESHDESGESLLMLMEEVTLRSWRDAFPLLKKSIMFECDFATITHAHMAKLGKSLATLETVAAKESIAPNGRLEKIRSKDPENIYTGSRFKVSAREE